MNRVINKLNMFRRALLLSFLSLATVSIANAQLAVKAGGPKTVTLNDKINKNQFIWESDAPLEEIKGSSEGVTGSFSIDPQDLSKTRGTISTAVCTMKTGNSVRDKHLQSSEWLDAPRCALISFTITSIDNVKTNGNTATGYATGNFTMHGVTKKMTIPIGLSYIPESDKTRLRAPGDLVMISAEFNISLKDFNIAGTDGAIGSKVGENIKITAQLFGNALPNTAS